MATFLRDEEISNITVSEETLGLIFDALIRRMQVMPEFLATQQGQAGAFVTATIRFDQKGNRVFERQRLLDHFNQATFVERVIFDLNSAESVRTSNVSGSFCNLRLDTSETVRCFLTVSSEDENWLNGTFGAAKEILARCKNRNGWIRNPVVDLVIQLSGLLVGFVLSLWAATLIAPNLKIQNAFLISFFLVLLMFSNLWSPINQRLRSILYRAFPSVRFYRSTKDRLHWLYQSVVGGVVVAITLYLLSSLFSYAGRILGSLIERGT
jgi:hypothetical protein